MPETPPAGIVPLFLREVTVAKFGIKTEGVEQLQLSKALVLKEIQDIGKISDFESAKKLIEAFPGDELTFGVDLSQRYGEVFLLYTSMELVEQLAQAARAKEEAELLLVRQREEEEQAKADAEYARLNAVYEDKPLSPRGWAGAKDTEEEIRQLAPLPSRDRILLEVYRRKSDMGKKYKFDFKFAADSKVVESRSTKDSNFKAVLESEMGIQVAPEMRSSEGQTSWYQSVNKIVQYEAVDETEGSVVGAQDKREDLLRFLELATARVELALQQNESVDIFHETFRTIQGDEMLDGSMVDNELKETKNFADPTYSKAKALAAIDWVPKRQDMLAVSGVRNINFDARSGVSGQSNMSYILLWDFRQLVRPVVLLEGHSEVFSFRFNPTNPGFVAGGCVSGQVLLWDIADVLETSKRRGSTKNTTSTSKDGEDGEGDVHGLPRHPVFVSNVDHSHNKAVADLFWLPANTQINYRGHLVGPEHLDGKSYQFVTVAGDGQVMVWDIRYEEIFADNLKHIGRTKHVPTEKSSNREGGGLRPLWAPIYRVHLKRFEGVGEYSLCKAVCAGLLKSSVTAKSSLAGDCRTRIITTTEEGDILFVDLNSQSIAQSAKPGDANKDDDEDDRGDASNDFVKWSELDQSRPSVALQQSPFFADVILTVGDWNFHIWKIGYSRPLFVSPVSESYLTAGCWSPTRPAVLLLACADGHIMAWDFTDSSYKPSIPLKATQARITSMQFLSDENKNRMQLLAAGDETGTLHIFELTRALQRPIHNEEAIMEKFLDRELQRQLNRHELNSDLQQGNSSGSNMTTFAAENQHAVVNSMAEASAREEAARLEVAAQRKEEDEFSKMENTFVTELNIAAVDMPTWVVADEAT